MGISLLGILGGLGSSLISGLFGQSEYKQVADAINNATKTQEQNYQTGLGLLSPYITGGDTALGYQLGALGLPGGVSKSDALNAFRDSPGYQWALGQGLNGVQTSAAANGSLFSGGTLKDLNNYASGMADQTFNNWLGNVGNIAGSGRSAAGSAVDLGSNTANNLSSLALANGSNAVSGGNTLSGALNSGLSSLTDLMKLLGGGTGTGTSSYTNNNNPAGLGTLY
jgi:hypothetical protein